MRLAYFDCFSGASGDMVLGALIDAGVPLDGVRDALGSLALGAGDAGHLVWTERVVRAGLTATKFCVAGEDGPGGHAHGGPDGGPHRHDHAADERGRAREGARHDARPPGAGAPARTSAPVREPRPAAPEMGGHPHRTLREIDELIDRSALNTAGKARAKALFERLGETEAAVHGIPIEAVHLHEVGALDSIIDIVGSVFALDALGVDRIVASPLNVGGGMVHAAHGAYPVPAPATIRLLRGAPIYSGGQRSELVTPTGALLVTSYADAYGPLPALRVDRVGYGAGARDLPGSPNVLRVVVGETDDLAAETDVVVLEAEIDDMSPQVFGVLMERLLADGALDVYYTAVQMKKNRPGTLVTVVAPPALRAQLAGTIFRETTTIGLRHREMRRTCLDREVVTVITPFGPVRVKVSRLAGEIVTATPEFDDCARLAAEQHRPFKDVQAAAAQAFATDRPRG